MTTLSRLFVNPQKRGARKLLTNAQAMHAAVRAAFPPDINENAGRVLWRVDQTDTTHTLYVVGPERPDLDHLVEQAGWSTRPGEVADYTPFLDSLRLGQEWAFRLVANPVRSVARDRGARGKIMPHVTVEQQIGWLLDRASASGFEVRHARPGGPPTVADVTVTGRRDLGFARSDRDSGQRRTVALRTARFDGSLRVTDVQAMRRALVHGIGRGRAYGCGLLTLAKRPQ